jgi:peptidoglycan hydrolase CwlO-like protein
MTDLFTLVALAMIGVAVSQGNWIRINFPKAPKPITTDAGANIGELTRQLREVEIERNQLKVQVADLEKLLQTLRDRLTDGAGEGKALNAELELLRARNAELTAEIAQKQADLDACKARMARLESDLAALKRDLEAERARLTESRKAQLALQAEVDRLSGELDKCLGRLNNQKVSRELLGLEGSFKRVVFLLDRSSSMNEEALGGSDRWSESIRIIETWLRYLPVEEVALITFGSDVNAYPEAGGFLPKDQGLESLVAILQRLSPQGDTRTMDALELAYGLPSVDAIFLFTDGEPSSANYPGNTAADIRRFVQRQRAAGSRIRIHTVGVGNYFKPEMGEFLQGLAKDTEGTFIGR